MSRVVSALFDTYDAAAEAVKRLEQAGIPYREISVVAGEGEKRNTVSVGTTDDAIGGAEAGASIGSLVGGGAGLLAGLGLVAIPGLGPMVAAGWLAATAIGAGTGAVTGGIIGALTGAGVSDEDAHVYAEGLRRGGTLVTVRVTEDQYELVRMLLDKSMPVDTISRRKSYQEAGWSRFDEAPDH
ncbi:MAG: general stress protein [Microvirga sp.]